VRLRRSVIVLAALAAFASTAVAEDKDYQLAYQQVNPLAQLSTATFKFNDDCCYGSRRQSVGSLSNQFVIPVDINRDWFVLSRTVIPAITTPAVNDLATSHSGIGDSLLSLFLTPRANSDLTIGVGPAIYFPSATDPALGAGAWGTGPTITLVYQRAGWSAGVLAHHIWSVESPTNRRDIRFTYMQPGIAYTFPDTTAIGFGTETVYDWTTFTWTVPLILGASHLFHFGSQPVSLGVSAKYYVATPVDGPRWGARFTAVFLFPKH